MGGVPGLVVRIWKKAMCSTPCLGDSVRGDLSARSLALMLGGTKVCEGKSLLIDRTGILANPAMGYAISAKYLSMRRK
jgi:hypothetical protein